MFSGRAMTPKSSHETIPMVLKNDPIAINTAKTNVKLDNETLLYVKNQVNKNAKNNQSIMFTRTPFKLINV
jgi:hypothetical protein